MKKKPNRKLVFSLLTTVLYAAALALIAALPGGGWWFGVQAQNVSKTSVVVIFTISDFASGTYRRSDNIGSGSSRNYQHHLSYGHSKAR